MTAGVIHKPQPVHALKHANEVGKQADPGTCHAALSLANSQASTSTLMSACGPPIERMYQPVSAPGVDD